MRKSQKFRGWIRIPIFSGTLTPEHRIKLRLKAEETAERIGAEIIKDLGERAELFDEVHPPVWCRFYLFQFECFGTDAT